MHSNNIIHLDLKPQNILLDEKYNTVIADFGLAHIKQNRGDLQSFVDLQGTL